MRTEIFRREVHLPSVDDFLARFPHYSAVRDRERRLFDVLVTPETFIWASGVVDALDMPAISGIADVLTASYQKRGGLTAFRKQLAGAIMCALMEANGYRKRDITRAVSREGWSRGVLFERVGVRRPTTTT